jgi:hypothetical protein
MAQRHNEWAQRRISGVLTRLFMDIAHHVAVGVASRSSGGDGMNKLDKITACLCTRASADDIAAINITARHRAEGTLMVDGWWARICSCSGAASAAAYPLINICAVRGAGYYRAEKRLLRWREENCGAKTGGQRLKKLLSAMKSAVSI